MFIIEKWNLWKSEIGEREEWNQWKGETADRKEFNKFLDASFFNGDDVIYQLYLMQVCVEGLLEDVDTLSDLVISLKDQATGKPKPKKSKK